MIQECMMNKQLETLGTEYNNKLKHSLDTEIPKAVQKWSNWLYQVLRIMYKDV